MLRLSRLIVSPAALRWLGTALSLLVGLTARQSSAAEPVDFGREIQPILAKRCFHCHGPNEAKGELRLNSREGALAPTESGAHAIVPKDISKSELIKRILSEDKDERMPPEGAPLTPNQVDLLKRWIAEGAEWKQHWSFEPLRRPETPAVKHGAWVKSPIDAFILSKLEAKGLSFSPDAPNEKLLRRAFLDLTGLPPSPAEIQDFRQHNNYERLIDQLLASPKYGERWGRQWLDSAGYVDTTGKDFDPKKAEYAVGMWRYRDYVIQATNADKPWNRFLTEQLAGDELIDWRNAKTRTPEINDLLTATGYLRNILDITEEDISNLPVERYEALFKLVETVSSSTLGLTVNCARCHSHKFDPISQKDYYRFLALFTTAYNPTDWIQPQNRHLYLLPTAGNPVFAERGSLVVDYHQVPDGKVPADWPKVVPNSVGLQMFVYKGTRDFMRRVSEGVTIGAAYKGEKALDHYFTLVREL